MKLLAFFLLQTRIKNCSRLKLAILQNHLTANLFSIYMQLLQCSIWAKQKPLWRKYICIGVRKPLSWTLSFFLFFERNLIFILKNHVTIYLVFFYFLRITIYLSSQYDYDPADCTLRWRVNSRRYAWPFFYLRTNKAHLQAPPAWSWQKWYWRRCGRIPRCVGRPQATSAGIPSSPLAIASVKAIPVATYG